MNTEKIILANNCIYESDPKITGVNRNILAVGGTGSGKTYSIVIPQLLEVIRNKAPGVKIFICTKRTVPDLFIPILISMKYKVYDLNFTDILKGNCTFDPLAYIKKDEDIIDLSESIVMAEERKEKSHADPFWDQSAISLLNAEIAYIKETMEHPTFADVLDFHFSLNLDSRGDQFYTDVDNKFYHLEKEQPTCFAVQQWKTFRDAAPKTAQSIYVSLNSTLMAFTETIRESMRTLPTVDFNQLEATNSILFITTSPVKRSLHTLGNIFVNRAITELHTLADEQPSGILKRPVHITFDDFATGAKVAGMPEKLSICREKGISFTLLVQSESQLSRMYGSYGAIEIMDNCDNYVFLGGNNYDTAKNISLKLNVPLEDILYMPIGQVIVFRRGQKPIITKRYDVLADPLYQSLKKNNTYIR